jgi:hypothetical protein
MSPVKYELGFYIPDDVTFQQPHCFNFLYTSSNCPANQVGKNIKAQMVIEIKINCIKSGRNKVN